MRQDGRRDVRKPKLVTRSRRRVGQDARILWSSPGMCMPESALLLAAAAEPPAFCLNAGAQGWFVTEAEDTDLGQAEAGGKRGVLPYQRPKIFLHATSDTKI
jgi:hypothetical protein